MSFILAHILKKSREYVLAHLYPVTKVIGEKSNRHINRRKIIKKNFGDGAEIILNKAQKIKFEKLIKRRKNHEPMAYILGHKEFYGLDFKVTKDTLIPRPETEQIVELVTQNVERKKKERLTIIDVGTGSGNIIISLAKNLSRYALRDTRYEYFGIDISPQALTVARYNAKRHDVDKKIKFFRSDLLKNKKLLNKIKNEDLIIIANLPYLSEKIYNSTAPDVKNFEPKSALLSGYDGLDHYEKLFQQIKILKEKCYVLRVTCYVEFSPEQKQKIGKIIKKYFPKSAIKYKKDLAGKWRIVSFQI